MEIYRSGLKDNEELSSVNELLKIYPGAKKFMSKYGKYCVVLKDTKTENRFMIRLYTKDYEYHMSFNKYQNKDYFSGCFTNRRFGIMESWHRGNDMADGHDIIHVLDRFEQEMLENELIYIGETEYVKEYDIKEENVVIGEVKYE